MSKLTKYLIVAISTALVIGIGVWAIVKSNSDEKSREPYVGLTETDAIKKAQEAQLDYRVVRRDETSLPVTDDYRTDRINFEIDDGMVTKAEFY